MKRVNQLTKLLSHLPEKPPRSKLQPYLEAIRELRSKNWTYEQIADYFSTELEMHVAPSTIHNFVKVRSKPSIQLPEPAPPSPVSIDVSQAAVAALRTRELGSKKPAQAPQPAEDDEAR